MFKIFIRRPVLSIVVSLVIAFIGVLALFNLPVTQFPSISPPKVNVVANYPGANNELLVKSVIIPLEQALNGVPGMKYIESDAGNDGEAALNVVFKLGTDPQCGRRECAKPRVVSHQQVATRGDQRRGENLSRRTQHLDVISTSTAMTPLPTRDFSTTISTST